MATGYEAGGAHPESIGWDEHAEEMNRLRAELTAEIMHLEALLDGRNREIESLRERLPARSVPASPWHDATVAAASARAQRPGAAGRQVGAPAR